VKTAVAAPAAEPKKCGFPLERNLVCYIDAKTCGKPAVIHKPIVIFGRMIDLIRCAEHRW